MTSRNLEDELRLVNTEQAQRIMALGRETAGKALRASEKRYRRLFESAKDGILILDADTGVVVDVNPFLIQLLGYSYDEFCDKHLWDIGAFTDIAASKDAFEVLQNNNYIRYDDLPLKTRDGHLVAVEFVSNVYWVDHTRVIQCNIRDISSRKTAEDDNKLLTLAIEQAGEAIIITDDKGYIRFVNSAFVKASGYSREEAIGHHSRILRGGPQGKPFRRDLWDTISSGRTWSGRIVSKHKDGISFTGEMTVSPIRDRSGKITNYITVNRDITEKLSMESQFLQAQKMEVVGLLAGGVAHDFNNMLSVIIGYTELAMEKIGPDFRLKKDLEEILKAATHSADITRQLLAFARKQTIAPEVLDLNHAVESMLKMLHRLIGENIHLDWRPKDGLFLVKMDFNQIDQILANLCVNARDAISGVGKITIETGFAAFDRQYCADHAGYLEGAYVRLTISDDGCGMSREILDHIFEPFFTSKEVGKGTGLGLSTVYGIVRQNMGFIHVSSVPDGGTTFKIYLPRYSAQDTRIHSEKPGMPTSSHGETVLLVEDEPSILKLTAMMLEELGYRVLAASTPKEALDFASIHKGEIRLLLTDVVMPCMNGRDLAAQLHSSYPDIKILFMSGYSVNVIAHKGILDNGVKFIQKPFMKKDLAEKVQEALNNTPMAERH